MWLVAPIDLDNLVGIRACDCLVQRMPLRP